MGKTLYLECYSGISGDMTVAALLDLGADVQKLERVLKSLPLDGFEIRISRVNKSGISACDFDVMLEQENHDHDMGYLHGHSHGKDGHGHKHYHNHGEEDIHEHGGKHSHQHVHRGMKEIRQIIGQGEMTENARRIALGIFTVLAQAESKAHNVPVEEVHFHEVGAVDSIVDIVSAAVCLDDLQVTEVIVPVLCEGKGTVRCQHGILPIPVPAVANIVQACHLPLQIVEAEGEFVTPTGAAIVAAIRTGDTLPKRFSIEKTGVGAGKRNYDRPGLLRAMFIKETSPETDVICKLESNIDDCTGEVLGYVMELLFAAGAKDVHYTPVFMKKNRPAWLLTVICEDEDVEILENIIFRETTTIGIRRVEMKRTILPRSQETVVTPFGEVKVKVCMLNGERRIYPEYESAVHLSRNTGVPLKEIYALVEDSNFVEEGSKKGGSGDR